MTMQPLMSRVTVDHPNYPGVWIVESNGPKNAKLAPEGGGRGLRAPHHMVRPVGEGVTVEAVPVEPYRSYTVGEFVTLSDPRWPGIYVVLADKGDKVNVAKAGGDDNRYIRALRRSLTPADVLVTLA